MDRLERLVNLVAALLDAERPLRASELRRRVPGYPDGDVAFHRAFSRDKATLRSMDIPLTVEWLDAGDPENGQGYRIPKQRYELPDLGLDADEVAALHLASTVVRLEGGESTQAIWKLGGVAGAGQADGPGSLAASMGASLPGSEYLSTLFGAVAGRQTVTFGYRGQARTVDPWRLSFRNGFWYLAGWDHERGSKRNFRLDRFDGPPETGAAGTFARPAEADQPARSVPWEMGDEEPVDIDILIDADQVAGALPAVGEAAVVERRGDGSIVVRLTVTNRAAARTFVLGMLEHAEILAPPSERDALIAWVSA